MNKKKVMVVVLLVLVATIGFALVVGSNDGKRKDSLVQKPLIKPRTGPSRVPAFVSDEKVLASLKPTLPPENFFGKAREAYQVAREIPQTLAQLPCYCYCDEGHGHKSLHTCYETDHSATCAMCIQEALLTYRLQKEDGLTPAQIRERIIKEFGQR